MMGLSSSSSPPDSSLRERNSKKIVASSFSTYPNPIISIEKSLLTHKESNCHVMPKSSEDLRKEIASLEFEILRTEQYLLSLYRTTFDEQVTSFSPRRDTNLVSDNHLEPDLTTVFSYHYEASPVSQHSSSCPPSVKALSAREKAANHTTLRDLLGSSHIVDNSGNPSRLSEEILRCISSVYCTHSKTTFGSKEANMSPSVVIDSLKLRLDNGSFSYAALMLQKFRSLVQKLDKVDPSRMKREEKLAFWINIHNSLTMHAYLAYRTHNRSSILKATYNVGGYRVNPHIIQSSILGICPHFSPPLLQTLFSPSRKSKTCNVKHIYALEYPEALAHFALSSGAFTDPPVRVYTADCVFGDLRRAKEEFIRKNVGIHNETQILLPKMVHYYAKDMSLDASGIMETMVKCLPESAKRIVTQKWLKKSSKNIEFAAENSSFGYVITGELAGEKLD